MTDNVIPINNPRNPIGTFLPSPAAMGHRWRATASRTTERPLDTADCQPLCEVLFADGTWLHVAPTLDVTPGPVVDSAPDRRPSD